MSKSTTLFIRFITMNLLLLLLSFFLFQTCSDDNSPTEPEAQPSLATATIGSGGGTLKTDDLELSVPLGSFAADTKITLSLIQEDAGFDNALSKEYKFEGIPQTFTKPLTIKIKFNGDLTENSFIAIGENTFVKSLSAENSSYRLISAKDSSGYLVATIPPASDIGLFKSSSNSLVNGDDLAFSALAIAGYVSYTSSNGHFKISFPSSVVTQVYDLSDYLETAYSKFQNLGFSYSRRTKWPVQVTVKRLASSVYGYSMNSMWGDNYGYMEFNFDRLGNAEDMKVTAGHEFFHIVQSLYDPRNRFSKAKFKSPHLWLDEASSVWSEEFFSITTGYVSSVFDINAYEVLNGAKEGSGDNAQSYGYGMTSLIKYLTKEKGDNALVEVYDKVYSGKDPFSAISALMPISLDYSWKSYLKKLFSFDLYNGGSFRPATLLATAKLKTQNFIIKSIDDTLKTYKSSLSDLGSTVFSIKNDFTNLNKNAALEFKCKGWNFQLYKVSSSGSKFIKSGKDSLTLSGFKEITDNGYQIVSVLYNDDCESPYNNSKDYEMEIRVKTPPKSFAAVKFNFGFTGTYRTTQSTTTYYNSFWNEGWVDNTTTQINGNTVIFTEDYTDTYNHTSNTTQIVFDDINNPMNIVSISCNETNNYISGQSLTIRSAKAINIPLYFEFDNGTKEFLSEGDISQHLTELNYLETDHNSDIVKELLNYETEGRIEIMIYYEE